MRWSGRNERAELSARVRRNRIRERPENRARRVSLGERGQLYLCCSQPVPAEPGTARTPRHSPAAARVLPALPFASFPKSCLSALKKLKINSAAMFQFSTTARRLMKVSLVVLQNFQNSQWQSLLGYLSVSEFTAYSNSNASLLPGLCNKCLSCDKVRIDHLD